jgi:hypothetical protein
MSNWSNAVCVFRLIQNFFSRDGKRNMTRKNGA